MAEALYRKYRPQIFEDVVGQEHIERTIKNAIAQDKVSHAYLFTGPRGTGKTTTARLLAKALLCEHGPTAEPDGTCDDCEMIANGEHPDVYELDAASRTGVENVREEIIGRVQFAPTRGRYKVYIIDEVHMLSTAAFNALLKTLEEPPSHVVFILATTDPQKVPETIHSRCQRFDFRRISTEAMVSRLGAICTAENVEFDGEALELIAHRAEGGMRNALTSLEQLIAFGDGSVTMEVAERMLGAVDSTELADIVRAVGARDAAACFSWVAEYVETGADMAQFVANLAEHMRNMYVMAVAGTEVVLDVSDATRRELACELPLFGVDRLARLLGVLGDVSAALKTSTNPRLTFEIALTRMVRPDADVTLEALAERVESLERQLAGAAVVTAAPAGAGAPAAAAVAPSAASPAAPSAPAPSASPAQAPASTPAPAAAPTAPAPEPVPVAPVAASAAPTPAASALAAAPALTPVAAAPSPAAPASAPAPEASASPAAGSLPADMVATLSNAASLQRLWAGVLASLKKAKAAYGVLFMNTKAVFDGQSLVVEFPAENDFAFKAVQKPDVQQELAAALRQEARCDIPFALRKAGAGFGGFGSPAASAPSAGGVVQPNPVAAAAARAAAHVGAPAPASDGPVRPGPAAGPGASAPAAPPNAAAPQPAPQSAPAAAPASPEEVPPWEAVPAAASPAPTPAPAAPVDDDRPPYDDYVPYDDADIPFEEPAPAAPRPATPAPAAPPQPAAPAPAMAPASSLPPEPDSVSGPSPNPVAEPDDADLNASLAFGFGDGITFQEVP